MYRNFAALKIFRNADPMTTAGSDLWVDPRLGEDVPDIGLKDALEIAVVMMMEDDGKNARQAIDWGHADKFVKKLLTNMLYSWAELNNGWPIEDRTIASALWLMWLLTSEEALLNQSDEERATFINLLLPFVYAPFRYPTALAPPNHFIVPPISLKSEEFLSTIPTPHGPYPIYPEATSLSWVHYATRPVLSQPLAAIPAKLLFFALKEMAPHPLAPHLDRTRADRIARGVTAVGPVREDIEEFNWSWGARLPMGAGIARTTSVDDGEDAERLERDGLAETPPPVPVRRLAWGYGDKLPISRWVGKAPHSDPSRKLGGKSAQWDEDWMRMRMCGDLAIKAPRVPLGRVYTPGCMDGYWVGRMQYLDLFQSQQLIQNAHHPPFSAFTEDSIGASSVPHPVFVRLRELHGVQGEVVPPRRSFASRFPTDDDAWDSDEDDAPPFAMGDSETHDGMNNAWFAGTKPPTFHATSSSHHVFSSSSLDSDDDVLGQEEQDTGERVEVRVEVPGRGVRGALYRPYRGRVRAERMGNDASADTDVSTRDYRHWKGHPHDEVACSPCRARVEFRARLKRREAREKQEREERAWMTRERIFASAGFGLGVNGGVASEDEDEEDEEEGEEGEGDDSASASDNDSLMSPWDGDDSDPTLPRTHNWARRAQGRCDGVREIVIVGQPDPEHAMAFHDFRYHGRVRAWDGLIAILRVPANPQDDEMEGLGSVLFYGTLVGSECFVGHWRSGSDDPAFPAWEGSFCWSRRED
ncbi:hypothetical protein DXG03_001512 [Asterophora parasitica]|uniref:Uncharacterized protein n=1 Tax=Asterophora parasitica TaxID=117018 RepID=A0A9P7G9G1_9AGAR|nr:hypothetical protein DXG03_001512 [Asterophora parasitica]